MLTNACVDKSYCIGATRSCDRPPLVIVITIIMYVVYFYIGTAAVAAGRRCVQYIVGNYRWGYVRRAHTYIYQDCSGFQPFYKHYLSPVTITPRHPKSIARMGPMHSPLSSCNRFAAAFFKLDENTVVISRKRRYFRSKIFLLNNKTASTGGLFFIRKSIYCIHNIILQYTYSMPNG